MKMHAARSLALLLVFTLLAGMLTSGCRASSRGSAPRVTHSRAAAPMSMELYDQSVVGRWGHTPSRSVAVAADIAGDPFAAEELWIIQRPSRADAARRPGDVPGTGTLLCTIPGEPTQVPVPLAHTDVRAAVAGFIATTDVVQTFHNPFDTTIEAVYLFPLPESAAVGEFVMTIGSRRIRGIIRDREQAQTLYREARSAGLAASLLTQERPNIFTQSVANIAPGQRIDVSIRYSHILAYDDGWLEYVFPMVVGPRFNPTGSTGGIGAAPRAEPGRSGQSVEVQYLAPSERSGHDISLAVELDAGFPVEGITCASHRTEIERPTPASAVVRLSPLDAVPNRDFVLRYRAAGDRPRSTLITHRPSSPDAEGYFAMMVIPPVSGPAAPRRPVEMIFVLDCSGSMHGLPLAQAKGAVREALARLGPDDTFQIIRFSDSSSAMGPAPIPATAQNVRRGLRHLDELHSEGGTMMLEGIRAALAGPQRGDRQRCVAFLTDGYIGNEAEVLRELHGRLGPARIFSFGVGSSPNRFLMDQMARLGRGAVAYLAPEDDAAEIMARFLDRATRPTLTDLTLDWGGMSVVDVLPRSAAAAPARLPDMLTGRPLIITGRYRGNPAAGLTIRGRAGAETVEIPVALGPGAAGTGTGAAAAIPQLWARRAIADLAERAIVDPDSAPPPHDQIRRLALAHGLVSAHTAFIAVDAVSSPAADGAVTVTVPVPLPAGMSDGAAAPHGSDAAPQ